MVPPATAAVIPPSSLSEGGPTITLDMEILESIAPVSNLDLKNLKNLKNGATPNLRRRPAVIPVSGGESGRR